MSHMYNVMSENLLDAKKKIKANTGSQTLMNSEAKAEVLSL